MTDRDGIARAADVADWFRSRGLPTFVPARLRRASLLTRTAPVVALLACLPTVALVGTIALGAVVRFEGLPEPLRMPVITASVLASLVLAVVLSALAALLLRRRLVRMPRGRAGVLAAIVVALATALGALPGMSVVMWLLQLQHDTGTVVRVALSLVTTALAFWFVGSGTGALASWGLRAALRHLGMARHMASTAVPLILTLVIFALYSGETWQLANALSWQRLLAFGGVLGVVASMSVVPVALKHIDAAQAELGSPERAELLRGTPLGGIERAERAPSAALGRGRRANLVGIIVVTQLLLGLVFAGALSVLLVIIGAITLDPATLTQWVGRAPAPASALGIALPWPAALPKSALFLGFIAALPFVISATTDSSYRQRFFDPMLTDVRRSLAMHDGWRALDGARGDRVGATGLSDSAVGATTTTDEETLPS